MSREAAGKRYIAFDVETPNAANDRISASGITVVENGALSGGFYSLVNPETHFDSFNIELTGITPEAAARVPSLPTNAERRRLSPSREPRVPMNGPTISGAAI